MNLKLIMNKPIETFESYYLDQVKLRLSAFAWNVETDQKYSTK